MKVIACRLTCVRTHVTLALLQLLLMLTISASVELFYNKNLSFAVVLLNTF